MFQEVLGMTARCFFDSASVNKKHFRPIDCAESVLETLTDSCHEYMLQITKLMRQAVDTEARSGSCPFQVTTLP